ILLRFAPRGRPEEHRRALHPGRGLGILIPWALRSLEAALAPAPSTFYTPGREERAMPTASFNGMEIYYEETGQGAPLVFSHEFGGDYRSWEDQVRYFSRRYRVVAYNHRGYPPSSLPNAARDY